MTRFKHLFEPIQIRDKLIRNRVVMAPMNNNFADRTGEVTSQLIDYYVERGKGGTGLIITSAAVVDVLAKKRVGELCAYSDDFIRGMKRLTKAVHEVGAKILLQIIHVGRELVSNTTVKGSLIPVGPSALPHPLTGELCHELNRGEIHEIRDKFIKAAERAEEGGFDGVEVHGAHGYLINQFTNPSTNRRKDEYGGSFEGRCRFPLEVVKGIRDKAGRDFVVCYRLNVNELFELGVDLQINESLALAAKLSDFLDVIHVSTGGTGTPKSTRKVIPLMDAPRGCYASLSGAVRRVVGVPVICVGRITSPETAETILARGDADMIAIGRGLLSDPHWANKAMEGSVEDIRRCISCNQGCMEYLARELKITCLQNYAVGMEIQLTIKPTEQRKRVLVVGGGIGGMEAARVAALRGHEVEIWEKMNFLGGNAVLAAVTPWKREFREVFEYLTRQIRKLNVRVRLNTEGILDHIIDYGPDVVVLATGAIPKKMPIFERRTINAFLAEEVLSGKAKGLVSPVCVIGGGLVGLETASFLRYYGHEVAVVEMLPEVGTDIGAINRGFWLEKISELRITVHTGIEVTDVDDGGLQVRMKGQTCLQRMEGFSTYVVAAGYQANNSLMQELESERKRLPFTFISVGDCVSPRNALYAIHEGYQAALAL